MALAALAVLPHCKSTASALRHHALTAEAEKSDSLKNTFTPASGCSKSLGDTLLSADETPPPPSARPNGFQRNTKWTKTDNKEKNSAQLKRLASEATSVCLTSQQKEHKSAPACMCVLRLVIDRHLAVDTIWPLFPRPAARMPPQTLDLCALMSCR